MARHEKKHRERERERRTEIHIIFLSENLKGRNYLENKSVDGRVVINGILKKYGMMV
jgi:hypothetical protein